MSGVITEEELEKRLNNPDNLCNKTEFVRDLNVTVEHKRIRDDEVTVEHKRIRDSGRREGDKNIPEPVRELAGTLAHFDTLKNVGESLGISTSQVHQYKNGRNGQHLENDELKEKMDGRKGQVIDMALDRLISSLGVITPEKLEKTKIINAAGIAQRMAGVIEKVSDKKADQTNVIFQLYAPRIQEERQFSVIEVEKIS